MQGNEPDFPIFEAAGEDGIYPGTDEPIISFRIELSELFQVFLVETGRIDFAFNGINEISFATKDKIDLTITFVPPVTEIVGQPDSTKCV